MPNRVYTAIYSEVLAPGFNFISTFQILSPGRELRIRSISLDWMITNPITNIKVPVGINTEQYLKLTVGNYLNDIANGFINITNPPDFNGRAIEIYEPTQLFFDSFFITNSLPFILQIQNNNAANDFINQVTIIVETEENPMYQ
jgi:hypothetical protein